MPDDASLVEKIDICGVFLDKLSDAQGRAKCAYIYIINEYMEAIKKDVLALEERLNSAAKQEDDEAP